MNTAIGMKVKATKVFNPRGVREKFVPGEVGAVLDWVVKDSKTGLVIPGTCHAKKSESFTRQFMDLLIAKFIGAQGVTPMRVLDIGNVTRDIVGNNALIFSTNGLAGDVSMGIIAGTGNTAPDISDYKIETIIANGVGAGQLQYNIVSWGSPASDATTSQFTITRDFANASGGDITVNEVALYVKAMAQSAYGDPEFYSFENLPYYFMTIRDVIAGGVVVGNGQTLTVNYRPQAVV